MSLIIPTSYAQVAIQFRRAGDPDPWYVTYAITELGDPEDYPTLVGDLSSYWEDNVLAFLPADTQMSGIQLRIGTGDPEPLTLFYPLAIAGLGSGTTLPQNCAVLITKQTSRPGRTGKGRLFWPTIIEAEVNGLGLIAGSYRDTLQGAWDNLFVAHRDGASPGTAHPMFLLHNEGVPGGSSPTEITGLQVDPVISTQRRRLR